MTRFHAIVLVIGCVYAATGVGADAAADATEPPTDEAVLKSVRDTTAHTAPDASAATAFDMPADTQLTWITEQKDNGFYRVARMDKGPQGWVAADDTESVHAHVHGPTEPPKPCAATLDACPKHGCAAQDSPEGVANEFKRAIPTGPLRATLSFGNFAELQRAADTRVRQGPPDITLQQRKFLTNMALTGASVSEGDHVRTIGYIAKDGEGLHVNKTGESVNCLFKTVKDNDFHIPLVERAKQTEFEGIVVEMIPQDRAPLWTIDALKEIQAKGLQVWVEGGLSYDNVHFVDADPKHSIKEEPGRMSLWEIHPITKFLICRKDHCDPNQESDWSALGDASKTAAGS